MENFFTHYSFNDYTYVALQVGRSLYDDSVLEIRQIDEKKNDTKFNRSIKRFAHQSGKKS